MKFSVQFLMKPYREAPIFLILPETMRFSVAEFKAEFFKVVRTRDAIVPFVLEVLDVQAMGDETLLAVAREPVVPALGRSTRRRPGRKCSAGTRPPGRKHPTAITAPRLRKAHRSHGIMSGAGSNGTTPHVGGRELSAVKASNAECSGVAVAAFSRRRFAGRHFTLEKTRRSSLSLRGRFRLKANMALEAGRKAFCARTCGPDVSFAGGC